jgi:predicted ATPase/DNA-binding SARP family transcriptional activator
MGPMSGLEFGILGPLAVAHPKQGPIEITAGKPRALLACLLLNANEVVSADRLVDALWGERPPASASKLLQVYVSQLRRAVGSGALATRSPGYVLRADPDQLDADRFERLHAEGRAALAAGNAALAASRLRRALELWRGPALADVAYADFAASEAGRLEELRIDCLEERLAAELDLGRQDGVLTELTTLVREHPLRERMAGLLMLALYRAGRQTEALEVYRTIRAHFRDALGLEPGAHLRELERAVLRHDPALGAESSERDEVPRLPEPLTPLVGREAELAELRRHVQRPEVRLVTLVGAGGSGKTRLALALAATAQRDFANGSAFVEVAAVEEPELVVPAIVRALGVSETAGEPVEATLRRWLRDRELLLVVDNLEHLVDAAPVLADLAAHAPGVTLVVTSRRVLHVSGERVFPVQPLTEDDAVALFVQRAQALRPAFELTEETAPAVREICRRLDGLPLAIELAAARMRLVDPRALLARLGSRLALLTGGPRDLPARQRTLRETLDWSANLIGDDERRTLSGLALFPGGATLDAADAVCRGDLDTLSALVDHSLAQRVERGGETYFTLLETIREYALERPAQQVERDETLARYAEWYLALAEEAEPQLAGGEQTAWFARLEAEHDNLLAALAHLAASGDAESTLRLTIALTRFWYVRGYLSQARRHLERALESGDEPELSLRRRALTAASAVTLLQGDYLAATAFAERSLVVARQTGEPLYVANALSNLGAIVLAAGDDARAGALLEEAVPLAREAGDSRIAALAINNLGDHALTVGDYERAGSLFTESLELLRERGDTANIARSLFNLGAVALMLGREDEASERLHESLLLCDEAGDKEDLAWCLEGFARLAAARGEGERAALLLGAATTILDAMGAARKPFERQLHEGTEAKARSLCGADAFESAFGRGAQRDAADARELAFARP